MNKLEELFACFPSQPEWRIDWEGLEQHCLLLPWVGPMGRTMQDPQWHGEGDVWIHTRLVCEELAQMEEFRGLAPMQRQEVFLAALLHDVGKIYCTKQENGRWISPHHGKKGASLVRNILWKDFSCSGDAQAQNFRETVCQLIRYHTQPPHIGAEEDTKRLLRIAANGELAKDFTVSMLCLLSEADLRGRIAADTDKLAEQVEYCRLLAGETGCFSHPKQFPSAYTERMYLSDRLSWPETELYDNTWGEVILLSGLPGTGKDTWIQNNCAGLPVVSLDEFRAQMGVSPTTRQSPVIHAAQKQARAYLQKRQPFVWNATNITLDLRGGLLELFENYGARVRVVFLETSWQEELLRNQKRERAVPEAVIEKMLEKLELPERFEAQYVEWHCV